MNIVGYDYLIGTRRPKHYGKEEPFYTYHTVHVYACSIMLIMHYYSTSSSRTSIFIIYIYNAYRGVCIPTSLSIYTVYSIIFYNEYSIIKITLVATSRTMHNMHTSS